MVLYNFMYLGSQRETDNVSGHLEVSIVGNEFAIIGLKDYGGFTSVGNEIELPKYSDSLIRQVHDVLIETELQKDVLKLDNLVYYPLGTERISANIGRNDIVINLETNTTFKADYGYDINHLNKNQFFQPKDRKHLWTTPISKEYFLNRITKLNPFEKYKQVDKLPNNGIYLSDYYIINDIKIEVYNSSKTDKYWIKIDNLIYHISTSILAPIRNTIELLTFQFYSGITIFDVKEYSFFRKIEVAIPKFNDNVSYEYNNALIRLVGNV
jgi:hypothetical protein